MKRFNPLLLVLVAGFGLSSPAQAADEIPLQQQVNDLNQRVQALEKRLNALERPEVMQAIEQVSEPTNPGDSSDFSNWNRLKAGFHYDEVEALLGKPVKIKKGAMEMWFYSDAGTKGPFVKFLFKQVNSWQAPLTK